MKPILGRFTAETYALLRFVAGLMFLMHGTQKFFGWPPGGMGGGGHLQGMMMLAAVIELVGGAMIAIGLLTSLAAFLASGEMAFAYFMAHAGHGGFWPIQNKGELAVLYCFLFLYFAASGSGKYSVDGAMKKS